MTFSIDDLPAPFGPMIARISPSRMSKLMSLIATTPPNRRVMFFISITTPPILRPSSVIYSSAAAFIALPRASFVLNYPRRRHPPAPKSFRCHLGCNRLNLGITQFQRCLDRALATIFVGHFGFGVLLVFAFIQGVDQILELLFDNFAAHFAGTGHFAVIGIQFLVQNQEAVDLAT